MDEIVSKANAQLKAGGCKVKIYQRNDGGTLFLQAVLPPKPSSDRTRPYQQRISLGVKPTVEGVKRAVAEAKKVDGQLALNQFDWTDHLDEREVCPQAGDIFAAFEAHYFTRRRRDEQTESTYRSEYQEVFKRIDPEARLTESIILKTIRRTEPDTRSRKRYCNALAKLVDFARLPIDARKIKDLQGSYGVDMTTPRTLLTDEQIESFWEQIEDPLVKLYWGYLATYGCRPSDLFHMDNSGLLNGEWTVKFSKKTKYRKERVAFPLPKRWVEKFQLRQTFDLGPTVGKSNQTLGGRISKAFKLRDLPQPYTLRHCWKARSIVCGVDPAIAARSLGHSVVVSQQHYTAHMLLQDSQVIFERADEMYRNLSAQRDLLPTVPQLTHNSTDELAASYWDGL